jgi:hypothetical protein
MTSGGELKDAIPRRPPGVVTLEMIEDMVATRLWAVMFAAIGWILSAFMLLGGIILFAVSFTSEVWFLRVIAYPYLAVGCLTLVPTIHLTRYASALRELRDLRSEIPLTAALHHERRLWKFLAMGLMVMIGLVLVGAIAGALAD